MRAKFMITFQTSHHLKMQFIIKTFLNEIFTAETGQRSMLTLGGKFEKQISHSSVPDFFNLGRVTMAGLLNGLITCASRKNVSWSPS